MTNAHIEIIAIGGAVLLTLHDGEGGQHSMSLTPENAQELGMSLMWEAVRAAEEDTD